MMLNIPEKLDRAMEEQVGPWLLRIVNSLVGRFDSWSIENLPEDEARQAVVQYAKHCQTRIDDKAIEQIWKLTQGDPLYISQLFSGRHNEKKDFTDPLTITEVYEKEMRPGGGIYRFTTNSRL